MELGDDTDGEDRGVHILEEINMMTNILAAITVCLVTNITEKFPQHRVVDPSPIGPNGECLTVYLCHWENDKDPKEKIVVTEIKEVTALEFDWAGEQRKITSEVVMSSDSKVFILKSGWEETKTNFPIDILFGHRFN